MSNQLPLQSMTLLTHGEKKFQFSRDDIRDPAARYTSTDRTNQLLSVITALSVAVTTKQVAEAIIQATLAIFNGHMGLVGQLSPDSSDIIVECIAGWDTEEASSWTKISADANMPIADAVREQKLIVLTTDESYNSVYPHMTEVHESAGGGAAVAVPLLIGNRCIGGLALLCAPESCESDEQQTFLWTLAGQCALALDRARLYDAERVARQAAVAEIDERKDAEETLRASEIRFRALADNIDQLAWMADANGQIFWYNQRYRAFSGLGDGDTTVDEQSNIVHPDHQEQVSSKYFEHINAGKAWEDTVPMRRWDGAYRWFLSRASPIRDESGAIVLWCGTNTDITDQREAEAKLAIAFRREALLNKIGQTIRGTRNPEEIQAAAVDALGEALGVDRAYFSMTDFRKDASWIGRDYRRGDLPSVAGTYKYSDYKFDPSAYHPEGKTLVVKDFRQVDWPELFAQAMVQMRIRAAIKVPIYTEGKMVARLVVAMADQPREWNEEEITLVETIAVKTRAAIDSAVVQEQEHRVAEQLQAALQPALPEVVPGLKIGAFIRPALDEAAIGGDFYDVFQLDEVRYALVIGDVSGKGLAAAQQLALIRNSLRTTLYLYKSPAKAATTLNQIVAGHRLLSGFVTAFVAVYDSELSEVTYCSCGHEPILLRRAANGTIEQLDATGYPLGIDYQAEYGEVELTLKNDDLLLLHTDGITESGVDRQHLLGTSGLATLLNGSHAERDVQVLAESVVAGAKTRANDILTDDVAVLVIRRQ